jgi:hypothetical protein
VIIDSFAVINQKMDDSCLVVLNINTKEIITQLGPVGLGPGDVIDPDFMPDTDQDDDGYLYLDDTNAKRFLKINFRSPDKNFELEKWIDYPEKIYPSSNLNYSQDLFVGRKVETDRGKMFYIYDSKTDSFAWVDYYPVVENLKTNQNYFYAPHLCLNRGKKRIVAGMYFFDLVQLYDLSGNRKKVISFSENYIPQINKNNSFDLTKGYSGVNFMYATKDYCYIKRTTNIPVSAESEIEVKTEDVIIQMDWDGNIVKIYSSPDTLSGGFCVDENTKKLFAIRHQTDSELNEYYDIVSFDLK